MGTLPPGLKAYQAAHRKGSTVSKAKKTVKRTTKKK